MRYSEHQVILFWHTPEPQKVIGRAIGLTQSADFSKETCSKKLLKFIIKAEHTSVLEHVVFHFGILNVSRAFLAQITRHRMASYTSASQHYTDYSEMPVVHELPLEYEDWFHAISNQYEGLVQNGVPIHEARMILTNASAVNLLVTINLRSLLNLCRQRTCRRNVKEMRLVATSLARRVISVIPELEGLIGPPCVVDGSCNQGKMSCNRPFTAAEFKKMLIGASDGTGRHKRLKPSEPQAVGVRIPSRPPEFWEALDKFQDACGHYPILEYARGLQMEVSELIESFQHKPWRANFGKILDRDNLKKEIIDCLFFLHHIANAANISQEELIEKFRWVLKNNYRRYANDSEKRKV